MHVAADEEPSSDPPPLTEFRVVADDAIDAVRGLLLEYERELGIDLCFQGFQQELADLPGAYAPPHGGLIIACVEGELAGCCAFRPLPGSDYVNPCEMKRLFVRRSYRGFGLGRQLAERVMAAAQVAGYDTMLLDTLSDMEAARALYQDLGFEEIAPFYLNPLPGAHYLKATLVPR